MYTNSNGSLLQSYDASPPEALWDAKPHTAVTEFAASPTRPARFSGQSSQLWLRPQLAAFMHLDAQLVSACASLA